jgi:hypothetical protein
MAAVCTAVAAVGLAVTAAAMVEAAFTPCTPSTAFTTLTVAEGLRLITVATIVAAWAGLTVTAAVATATGSAPAWMAWVTACWMVRPALIAFVITWVKDKPAATSPATSARTVLAPAARTIRHIIPHSSALIIAPPLLYFSFYDARKM